METNSEQGIVKEPLILRCLKAAASVDWKALALVLATLAGFGGAIWNRVDAIIDKAFASRTQQGVYELLAQRMDELVVRMDVLEGVKASPPIKVEALPTPTIPTARIAAKAASIRHRTRHMPSFATILEHAQSDRMPVLLESAPTNQ